MKANINRVLIAGTHSGSGKTTVSLALTAALKARGEKICAFKCGPDYIDPMFYKEMLETPCRNLDTFLCAEDTVRYLFVKHARHADVAVIEGVMGYYDGLAGTQITGSTCDISMVLDAPTILVVNPKGASLSVAAQIHGFCTFAKNKICGVVFNQIREGMYSFYKEIVETQLSIPVYGFLPNDVDCSIESRHLGLLTASEVSGLSHRLKRLGALASKHLDIEGILACAASAAPIAYQPLALPQPTTGIRIAVAQDMCFQFYYEDNLDLLRQLGAELVSFSPMQDTQLPEGIHGLYLGGGYPELYAEKLEQNEHMRQQIKTAIATGMPTLAECGGFLYLQQALERCDMVGALPGEAGKTDKLQNFGYITLTAQRDTMLCRAGESIRAHEFHYVSTTEHGDAFMAQKPLRSKSWQCIHASKTLHAGFPHLHFYANLQIPASFFKACLHYQQGVDLDEPTRDDCAHFGS